MKGGGLKQAIFKIAKLNIYISNKMYSSLKLFTYQGQKIIQCQITVYLALG